MTPPTTRSQLAPVLLVCTDCEHIFQPDLVRELSLTGCERCGGWTWIAQTDPPELPLPRAPLTSADLPDPVTRSFGGPR